jgi:hypothetical protein
MPKTAITEVEPRRQESAAPKISFCVVGKKISITKMTRSIKPLPEAVA